MNEKDAAEIRTLKELVKKWQEISGCETPDDLAERMEEQRVIAIEYAEGIDRAESERDDD